MSFLFPGFLWAAGAVSAGVVLLHLLVTQQPRSEDLPTVRFVPDVPARSTSVAIKPSDLLLLLVRVLTIMLLGMAFAQPVLTPNHQDVGRLVMVDVSRSSNSLSEVADSARVYANGATAVVLFDSVAREVDPAVAVDSIAALASAPVSARNGAMSSGLISTLRAASRVRDAADSFELVVISPFVNEGRDAATSALRELWPGHITPVQVAAASDSVSQATSTTTQVEWADSAESTLWTARETPDTIGALRAGNAVLVFPFERRWRPADNIDSLTTVFARWSDGEPAAFERVSDGTCVRSVAASMPTEGDAILRPDFERFLNSLSSPCGTRRDVTPWSPESLNEFAGPANLAAASAIQSRDMRMTPLVPWLLAGALLLALLELLVRKISGRKTNAEVATGTTRARENDAATEVAA